MEPGYGRRISVSSVPVDAGLWITTEATASSERDLVTLVHERVETHPRQAPLSALQLESIHAWWRAANYLSVGQIYLLDNPLLREPLRPEHVKPRRAHISMLRRLCRQFSFPGGIPSHVAPETPDRSTRAASSGTRCYTRELGDDPPDVRDWTWPAGGG
jgi:XFP-like protein